MKATLILDAVGGKLSQQLFDAAPFGSTMLLYANLSAEQLVIEPHGLWSANKRVAGFFLGNWAARRGVVQVLMDVQRIQRLGATDLRTTVQKRLPLSAAERAVTIYENDPTAGKVLLVADPDKIHLEENT